MKSIVHILNGDSLLYQFPSEIEGKKVVCRECLAFGDVSGNHLNKFYNSRAQYITANFKGVSVKDYFEKTVSEFEKLKLIPQDSIIYVWFEDDVFCQVNFWFILYLLRQNNHNTIFLIRPPVHTQYGFSGLTEDELFEILKNGTRLSNFDLLEKLWLHFKEKNYVALLMVAKKLKEPYPFIYNAIVAFLESIPAEGKLGKPSEAIIEISKNLNTKHFQTIFKEFTARLPVYGYGDEQVKLLYLDLIAKKLI